MANLGPGRSRNGCWCRRSCSFRSSALSRSLSLLSLALPLGLVGLDLGLDAFLGLDIVELLLTLAGSFFDLLLALELLLGFLALLGRLLSDLLCMVSEGHVNGSNETYLIAPLLLFVLDSRSSLLSLQALPQLI